ncbi:hypothetical protein [Puniceibacterium sp. IMCC21224]|uniref:hypothetical protein n=1 Tax=Puniceibacterium sp. IMCC21224 TaxID=1618204 RepID=UPI00064DEA54|nr:hypothetical protein [Puniceibacterium sp. IMCC21224]KMK67686.1 hypothetical protein IMCC21224_112558 [Puniceibacterium sp. IMCC21224]
MTRTDPRDTLLARVFRGARALFLGEEARVAQGIILQFFVTIALPVLLLLGVPTVSLFAVMGADPRLWQALIAGLVIATGWLTTAIFAELGKRRTRAERLRDYHKALFAEIQDTLSAFYGEGQAQGDSDALLARMQADAEFVPLIPRESHDRVFSALLEEIEVLPRQTIDAVVSYYSLITSIMALAEDMRGDTFRTITQDRRIQMYLDYVGMRQRAYQFGEYTLRLINAYSTGGAIAAEALTQAFNSPGGAPSDPSPGSE